MQEPTAQEVETALDVLEYYETRAEEKGERMLRALMADSQSHVRSYAPIVFDENKWEEIRDL